MRITTKGQVTIPKDVREGAGLMAGTDVEFVTEDGAVRLNRSHAGQPTRGQKLVESQRGAGDFRMTTEEIVAQMRGPRTGED